MKDYVVNGLLVQTPYVANLCSFVVGQNTLNKSDCRTPSSKCIASRKRQVIVLIFKCRLTSL